MRLSDKRKELSNYGLQATESFGGAVKFYTEDDVKQAVKELKGEMEDAFNHLKNLPSKPITPYMWDGLLQDIQNQIAKYLGRI